jgi:hypothetical protein
VGVADLALGERPLDAFEAACDDGLVAGDDRCEVAAVNGYRAWIGSMAICNRVARGPE